MYATIHFHFAAITAIEFSPIDAIFIFERYATIFSPLSLRDAS